MSILKREHTDGSNNLLLLPFAYLFHISCQSSVTEYQYNLHCTLPRWHLCRHYDANNKMHWAYGDDFGK